MIQPAENNLLRLTKMLSLALKGMEIRPDNDTDISSLCAESYAQGVVSLIFGNITTGADTIPLRVFNQVKGQLSRSVRIINAHTQLHKILTEEGIPYIILKGCASGNYYPDIVLRSYGDVDFLTAPDDTQRTADALIAHGYCEIKKNHPTHRIFTKDGIRYELHREPAGIPNGKPGEIVRELLKDAIMNGKTVTTDFGDFTVPDDFSHGLILLLHTAHHLTAEGIGLRQLCDWCVFIDSFSESEFVLLFEHKLKSCGLWDFTKILTACTERYLGCKEFFFTDDIDSNLPSLLLSDILEGGNLGQKSPGRAHEAFMISSHGKNGVGKSGKISQLFLSVKEITVNKYPITGRHPVLILPYAVFLGTRYIFRSVKGERPKINPYESITKAQQRIDLYKKFNLYDITEK